MSNTHSTYNDYMNHKSFHEGSRAYDLHRGLANNPYRGTTWENQWRNGYMHAQSMDVRNQVR